MSRSRCLRKDYAPVDARGVERQTNLIALPYEAGFTILEARPKIHSLTHHSLTGWSSGLP
jgi:hypothetical protein